MQRMRFQWEAAVLHLAFFSSLTSAPAAVIKVYNKNETVLKLQ